MPFDPSLSSSVFAPLQELSELVDAVSDDVSGFERELMGALMKMGRAIMQARLESISPTSSFVEGEQIWRIAVRSNLPVMTLFGEVSVARPLFRAVRNGPTRCLVRERAGLFGFFTEPAAKLGVLAVAEMSMARAESFFAEAGILPVSSSSLLRLAGGCSDIWEGDREAHEEAVREALTIPDEAATVAVSLDGVMVLLAEEGRAEMKAATRAQGRADRGSAGWSEASVGVISFYDAEARRLATLRYARMPESGKVTTKAWLRDQLRHIRKLRPDLKVLAIADGAPNNWSFLEELEADVELVDFFHTALHLHNHVNKAMGAASLAAQHTLSSMRRRLLNEVGAAPPVFEELQAIRERGGTASTQPKRKGQPDYFQRHCHRMDYVTAREGGLPIGTGVTESTCKLVVCDRLRRTGMRWSPRGGQAILTFRAMRVSNTFQQGWSTLVAARSRQAA